MESLPFPILRLSVPLVPGTFLDSPFKDKNITHFSQSAQLRLSHVLCFMSHVLMHAFLDSCHGLNMLGPGNNTIWRCDPLGVGVSLWVWALRPSSYLPGSQSSASSLQTKM